MWTCKLRRQLIEIGVIRLPTAKNPGQVHRLTRPGRWQAWTFPSCPGFPDHSHSWIHSVSTSINQTACLWFSNSLSLINSPKKNQNQQTETMQQQIELSNKLLLHILWIVLKNFSGPLNTDPGKHCQNDDETQLGPRQNSFDTFAKLWFSASTKTHHCQRHSHLLEFRLYTSTAKPSDLSALKFSVAVTGVGWHPLIRQRIWIWSLHSRIYWMPTLC